MEHMPFGLVLKEDGTRFRSSEGDSVKLMSLLDEAVNQAFNQLKDRLALS